MRIAATVLSLGLAACAAQPTTPEPGTATAAPAAPAAAATGSAAPAPAASATAVPQPQFSPELLKKARSVGLVPRVRKGQTLFCKDYAELGTRFTTEHCYDADHVDDVIRQMVEAQDMMRRSGACPNAACGSQ